MKAIHCEACGRYARVPDDADSHPMIPLARLGVLGFDVGPAWLDAHLCMRCLTRVRTDFFDYQPDALDVKRLEREQLEGIPLMPLSLERGFAEVQP
jgi:hypothetical protein